MTTNEKRSVTARLNPTRKAKLEALASIYYKGSQADTIRRWIDEQFSLVFGDLDPTALLDGRVGETDARTIMSDIETDTEELLEDVGIDDDLRMDDDDAVPAVAQDGGVATAQPERFETMLGPEELAKSGPALEWDELRDIVSDDGHWSETLEIHPDRVQPGTLKSNHKISSRIVAAMARSEANGGIVPSDVLDDLITENLGHLHDRVDEREGMNYIVSTYEPLVRRHLWMMPNPVNEGAWVDREKHIDAVERAIKSPWIGLGECVKTETVFNPDRWKQAAGFDTFDTKEWHRDLGDWLEGVANLQNIAMNLQEDHSIDPAELAVDVPDQYPGVVPWLLNTVGSLLDRFTDAVSRDDRQKVLDYHVDDAVEELIRPRLE